MDRHLLILDLDETLLHGTEKPLARAPDFLVGGIQVYRRPFLNLFLETVAGWFDVAVWTDASHDYAQAILQNIALKDLALQFLWSRERSTSSCESDHQLRPTVKDLRKVKRAGYPLERVLMIDDTASNLSRHYGNHLQISGFRGDLDDTELRDILPFLDSIRTVANVRTVEKRNWREVTTSNLYNHRTRRL